MEEFKNEGIYAIVNTITNELYVGASTNIGTRKQKHFSLLKHGKHQNSKLQESVTKYGIENFVLKVLEYTTSLSKREQYYVDLLCPSLNITTEVINNTPSEESKRKMSITRLRLHKEGLININCAKAIVAIDLWTGTKREFPTVKATYTQLGLARTSVQRVLNGTFEQTNDYKFYTKQRYEDLIKLGELLEKPEQVNQQPS